MTIFIFRAWAVGTVLLGFGVQASSATVSVDTGIAFKEAYEVLKAGCASDALSAQAMGKVAPTLAALYPKFKDPHAGLDASSVASADLESDASAGTRSAVGPVIDGSGVPRVLEFPGPRQALAPGQLPRMSPSQNKIKSVQQDR